MIRQWGVAGAVDWRGPMEHCAPRLWSPRRVLTRCRLRNAGPVLIWLVGFPTSIVSNETNDLHRAPSGEPGSSPDMDFVVFDFETANPCMTSICQVGAAEFRQEMPGEGFSLLIDPQDFYETNLSIRGIDHRPAAASERVWCQVSSPAFHDRRSLAPGSYSECPMAFLLKATVGQEESTASSRSTLKVIWPKADRRAG